MTEQLIKTGFWGSFNVPSFKKTRDNLGYTQMIKKFGQKAQDYDHVNNIRNQYLLKRIKNISNIEDIKNII